MKNVILSKARRGQALTNRVLLKKLNLVSLDNILLDSKLTVWYNEWK